MLDFPGNQKPSGVRLLRARIFTNRRLGTFLFVMAGVAAIDWVIAMVLFRGPAVIIELILHGETYHTLPPLPQGLIYGLCPGNGYSFLCAPWALFLLILVAAAVAICAWANFIRMLSRLGDVTQDSRDRAQAPMFRERILARLPFGLSVVLALGIVFGWWQYIFSPSGFGLLISMYQVLALFIPPLFIVISLTTGRYLRRSPEAG